MWLNILKLIFGDITIFMKYFWRFQFQATISMIFY